MEWLQQLMDNSTTPVVTAFVLGLVTALSPCPLAMNIAAIGYIGKQIESRKIVFINGLLYTLGRTIAYTLLGLVLIILLRSGASVFGVQKFIATYGEMVLGPALLLGGMFMFFGGKLNLPSFGYKNKSEDFAKGGAGSFFLGILFAMAFCPTSGVCYFGMLIPLSATVTMGYLLPVIFAIATSLPVIIIAWILAFSTNRIGEVYGKMQIIQKWLNVVVGVIFILIGLYYCLTIFF